MHTVGDQFDGHPRVFEERDDRPGLTTIDRAHRVEQVRAHRRARRDRRPRLLVGRLGVADGGHRTRVDDPTDRRKRTVAFGCEGDHANSPAACGENAVDLGGVRVTHQGRLVRAAPLGGNPWTFEMDSGDHAGTDVVGQFADLAQQLGRIGGDERGNKCGGAVPAVEGHGGGRLGVDSGGEVRASPAVHMRVDEARHHRHRAEFAIRRTAAKRQRRPHQPRLAETSIHPGRNSSQPVSTVSAVNSTQMPCHSGLER